MVHRGLAGLFEHLGDEALSLAFALILRGAGPHTEIVVAAVGHGSSPGKLRRVLSRKARGHANIGAGFASCAAR